MKKTKPTQIGIVGCGNISGIYFSNLTGKFAGAEVVACADLDPSRAEAVANAKTEDGKRKYPNLKAMPLKDIYAHSEIEIILNLTIPKAHHPVGMQALKSGKHVYGEKPFAVSRKEGLELLETAKAKGLRTGSAADTFLGAGVQTARKLIDDGWIGDVIAATAFMCCHGHESWHPDPEFYYQKGGGPLFDMGPYYLAALMNLIGPIQAVACMSAKSFDQRTITSQKKYGTKVDVEVATHLSSSLQFHTGAIGTMIMSFDVWKHSLPNIEIHGTEGSLSVPDPNGFGGDVRLSRGGGEWKTVPHAFANADNARGIGVLDMAVGIREGRPHRASGELGYHILDVMTSIEESAAKGKAITLASTCDQPAPVPMGLISGVL
ncbi:MAG: Gfo/Idh/MocA family oxidoreductase [Verrucomicrobia bacterium]|nr:Gfo/Idh/MocA family oxidoreductase [Verrucomicrobiota bacterium]